MSREQLKNAVKQAKEAVHNLSDAFAKLENARSVVGAKVFQQFADKQPDLDRKEMDDFTTLRTLVDQLDARLREKVATLP